MILLKTQAFWGQFSLKPRFKCFKLALCYDSIVILCISTLSAEIGHSRQAITFGRTLTCFVFRGEMLGCGPLEEAWHELVQ